jgi:two-component system cell cycle response regulator
VKILIAEDEPVSRHRLQAFLRKWGYDVQVVGDGAEALEALAQPDGPKLVVLDRTMPQFDGLEVCRTIRKSAPEPYVYMILLTGHGRQEEIIEGFEAGADDYIIKPFEVQELKARVRTGARIVELQEELIAAREQLRVEAMHDALTGFLNHAAFLEILDGEISRARRQHVSLAVIMADLDHFKEINDRYGHQAGDTVLRETACRLRRSLRASDVIGRYGGEEFVVAAPNCSTADAGALAERFRSSICDPPIAIPAGNIQVTVSIGVAASASPSASLLRVADEALYRAKHAGRNRVELEVLPGHPPADEAG